MNDHTRQNEVQALSGPVIEEAIARLSNAGIAPHEIAQALVLTGAGLLAGSLGPNGAGHNLRCVADTTSAWIRKIADSLEKFG
jgi:hypothetical protein